MKNALLLKQNYLKLFILAAVLLAFSPLAGWAQTTVTCYPPDQTYATGYTTSSSKTSGEMHTVSNGGVQGWMKFDVSSIPDKAIISDVTLYFYCTSTSNSYVKLTSVPNKTKGGFLDPNTATASALYSAITDISADNPIYYSDSLVSRKNWDG